MISSFLFSSRRNQLYLLGGNLKQIWAIDFFLFLINQLINIELFLKKLKSSNHGRLMSGRMTLPCLILCMQSLPSMQTHEVGKLRCFEPLKKSSFPWTMIYISSFSQSKTETNMSLLYLRGKDLLKATNVRILKFWATVYTPVAVGIKNKYI
jgi:hypothetical protein